MSDLHVSLTQQEMEESGEMDFIRSHVAAANAAARGETAPPPAEADTAESEIEEEIVEEVVEAAVTPDGDTDEVTPSGDTELTPEEEETLYLELDDATQALIDSKYGGDVNKALASLADAQSVIGRQGNELGAVRAELAAFREQMLAEMQHAQPYAAWPDEYADASESASALRTIAEQAFDRRDPEMFQRAIMAWTEADPVSAGLYRDLKEMQVRQIESERQSFEPEDTLEQAITNVVSDFPQFQVESFQAEVGAELDKTPSLKAVLWGNVPGVSVEERATILREAAQRVVARTTSETATAARKRIAVRASEEARAARVATQVARGTTAREVEVETPARTVAMGDTGRSLNIDRLNAMLPEGDRI